MGVYVNARGVGEELRVIISQGHSSFPYEATFMEFHPTLSLIWLYMQLMNNFKDFLEKVLITSLFLLPIFCH